MKAKTLNWEETIRLTLDLRANVGNFDALEIERIVDECKKYPFSLTDAERIIIAAEYAARFGGFPV